MAALVGNLYRRLGGFTCHNPHPNIDFHLKKIRGKLNILQPFLIDAEWKRDLDDTEWRRDDFIYGYGKIEQYGKIARWVSRVAALATEIEDIIVSYNFHLCNINTDSLYSKLLYLHFYTTSFESVLAKIGRFMSKTPQILKRMNSYIRQSNGHLHSEDEVPLLSKSVLPADSISSWHEWFLGIEMMKSFQRFSNKVTEEIEKLIGDAIGIQLIMKSQEPTTNVSKIDLGKDIQTVLDFVNLEGRQTETERLEGWLLALAVESDPVVIGVTGEPGIGKTTLVSALYDCVQRNFDCHAWVFLSPNPNFESFLRDVLIGILKSMSVMVPNNMDSIHEATLKEMIYRRLRGKKLLLVLDDVPGGEKAILDYVKLALPQDCKAKIICTSRTNYPDYNHVLELQRLTPQDAFNLLKKRACLGRDHGTMFWASAQLELDAILHICDGLPLAISTVGGMLSMKKLKSQEWNEVHHKLKEAHFIPLSYADMSPELKSCFLYTASLPSHLEVSCKRLQRLWIAEGFVKVDAKMTLEEASKLQLYELIQRNMIQVVRVDAAGEVVTCRVLGPLRDYALRKSQQDQSFFTFLDSAGDNASMERPHRLILHADSCSTTSSMAVDNRNLGRFYSFLAFKPKIQPLLNTFKLLSVLELQELSIDTLPNALGDLVLLRYLSLRGTKKLKKISFSLKKLHKLETLDIRDTFVRDLPVGLESLAMLRHLLLAGSYSDTVVNVSKLNVQIGELKNLQTLAGLKLTMDISEGLRHIPQLQKLSVGEVERGHSVNLLQSIDQMKFLRSFTIKCAREEKIDMTSCQPHYSLEKLRIGGRVQNFLNWVLKLQALKYVYLWDSMMTNDPFSFLQHLPNLVVLSLCNAYDGEEIKFGERGFRRLKKLSILHCKNLKQWSEIRDGAMRRLQMLTIAYCPKLSEPPKGLGKLGSLQELQVSNMAAHFINQARGIQLSSKFSLHVLDATQPSAAVKKVSPATKRLPMFMPTHSIIKMEPSDKSSLPRSSNLQEKKNL